MKKFLLIILSLFILSLILDCANKEAAVINESTGVNEKLKEKNKIKIVTTIYPEYDWLKNIIKGEEDRFDISILMSSGVDLHNFQPTAKDILDIWTADLFVYVGGESDDWAESAIRQAPNVNLKTINLMALLKDKVKIEESKEGMEEEEHHEEEIEYDEHVWLSLKNAMLVCSALENEIEELDKENEVVYKENLANYLSELTKLDAEYREIVSNAKRKVLLFGDRFPFRYMVEDYGIDYYAAFKGCSAETEASFKTIKFLSDKLSEEDIPYVVKIEKSDEKIARAIIENSSKKDASIETMYSVQAVDKKDIENGETYLSYMKKNAEVLKKVLN